MHTKGKRLLLLSLGLVLLLSSSLALSPLQRMRNEYDLSSAPVTGLTPELALATQVLGWGRGLIIDVIWIRMETLKSQDRYFELVQLADWACKLAPHFPHVWAFNAWNLAYNVSCRVEYLPDRWAWVQKGIELLRDEAIPLNPNSPMLYDRLAWIIGHKIGEQDDNAHFFYKQTFGLYMHEILGGEGDGETLRELADAPRTLEEALADPDANRLWNECLAEGFDIAEGFFDSYVGRPSVTPRAVAILNRPENAGALHKIGLYARAKRLREECKLEPERMLALREKYGPFDWRVPFPHAIYWATVGLEVLDGLEKRTEHTLEEFDLPTPEPDPGLGGLADDETLYEYQRVSLKRRIYSSMQGLVLHGRLLYDPKGRLVLAMGPDYRFADATLPLYDEIIEAHGTRYKLGTSAGLQSFLSRGVMEFAFMGNTEKSMEYFERLREEFPNAVKGRSYDEYRQFVLAHDQLDMTTSQFRRLIAGRLIHFYVAMACNDDEKAWTVEEDVKQRVEKWNEDAEQNLRGQVRYKQIKDGILLDILGGYYRLPKEQAVNLAARLKEQDPTRYEWVRQTLQKDGKALPEPEEVEDKWQVETY